MDLARLKHETAPAHHRAESLIPLMQPGLDEPLYQAVLTRLHGFIKGWELWAEANAPRDESLRAMLAERRRSHLLEADLFYFGVQPPTLQCIPAYRRPVRPATFLGSMYVIEGSTLGSQYIARHLAATLGLSPARGASYFHGHGDRTGSMWRRFQRLLEAVPARDAKTVIAAANHTYKDFAKWMVDVEPSTGAPSSASRSTSTTEMRPFSG